jgi:hypothetical protein
MSRLLMKTGRPQGAVLIALGLCTVLAAPSSAEQKSRARKLRAITPVEETQSWVGDREITSDKATGAVRKPTRDEAKALAASLRALLDRSPEGVQPVSRADGIRQVNLAGRFGSVVLARPAADGTMETRCVFTFEEATAFLGLRPATPADAAGAVE